MTDHELAVRREMIAERADVMRAERRPTLESRRQAKARRHRERKERARLLSLG